MASMAELARQLLGMNGNSVGGVSPDRYMEIMDRSPYGTGVPLEIGYGEQDQMSPLDAAAIVTGGVPVVGDLTGLAADVDMYMRDPESRNIPNYLLTAACAFYRSCLPRLRSGRASRLTTGHHMISRLSVSLRCLTVPLCTSTWMTRCQRVPA
jgi:hypothetical protein